MIGMEKEKRKKEKERKRKRREILLAVEFSAFFLAVVSFASLQEASPH